MEIPILVVLAYGILVILGGIMGYLKAKSLPSLIAGSISGVLILLSAVLMYLGVAAGAILAMLLCVALTGIFVRRLSRGAGLMPAVPMIVLSLLTLAVLLWDYFGRSPVS